MLLVTSWKQAVTVQRPDGTKAPTRSATILLQVEGEGHRDGVGCENLQLPKSFVTFPRKCVAIV